MFHHFLKRQLRHDLKSSLYLRNLFSTTTRSNSGAEYNGISFSQLSNNGYAGELTRAYKASDFSRLRELAEIMKNSGEVPSSTQTYNFLLHTFLHTEPFKHSFLLLKDMEEGGIVPDTFTFEILLSYFCKKRATAIMVEELFQVMKAKYGLKPSISCWSSRIKAWAWSNDSRTMSLLAEMMETFNYPNWSHLSSHFVADLTFNSFAHGWLRLLEYLFSNVIRRADLPASIDQSMKCRLRQDEWLLILSRKNVHFFPNMIPYIRIIMANLKPSLLTEGIYAHTLYLACSQGTTCIDLAHMALTKLAIIHGNKKVPRHYLEAFVQCAGNGEETLDRQHNALIALSKRVKERLSSHKGSFKL